MIFFEVLYGSCERGWLTIFTSPDPKTYWFHIDKLQQAITIANTLAGTKNVYFGVGLRKQKVSGRGTSKDVCAIPGLWIDIDIAGDAHKQNKLPVTVEDALKILSEFPLSPSIIVSSGYGLHAYWLFKEPWEFENEKEQQEAVNLLSHFQMTLRTLAEEKYGWKLDNTSDLARVLRVPGTFNHKKNPPVKVEILELHDDRRYNPSDFEPYLREFEIIEETIKFFGNAGPAETVIKHCKFIQHCRDNAKTLPEPEWYAMITNLVRATGGKEVVHKTSKPYPGYSPRETEEKIKHALEDTGPHTCQYIRHILGFNGCPEEGCGVKAPIVLAVSPVAMAKAQATELVARHPEDAFSPEIIGALAILKKQEPAEYGKIKQFLKGKVNLNDLERAVNDQIAKNQHMRVVGTSEPPEKIADILSHCPFPDIIRPYAWTINENGVWQASKDGPVCACCVPVVISQRLINVDTGEEKVEIAFYRDSEWQRIKTEHATAFSRTAIVQLGNKGLPVSTENAKTLVQYLTDLESANLKALPIKRSANHLGWIGRNFIPGAEDDIVLDFEEGTAAIAAGYRESGVLENWTTAVMPLMDYPLAKFAIAASFAAPLLRILGQRVFIIHLWGPSRGGKTAALKAALSVWGNPDEIMASFYGTKVGLERLAAFYCDLPLGIDERQVAGDKQAFIESLVYLLGMGKGKIRGTKKGGLQVFNQWRTIVLSTGEHPLSTESSIAGITSRTIEFYGKIIPDEQMAENIHHETLRYYGTAGPAFIRKILEELKKNPDTFHEDYNAIREDLWKRSPASLGSHIAAMATVCVADYYASKWIFGLDEDKAYNELQELIQAVVNILATTTEVDDAVKAYDFLMSWYAVNSWAFSEKTSKEKYGMIDDEYLYIYPSVFEKAIREGGYNPKRVMRDLVERGWLKTEKRSGKIRHKIRKYDPILGERVYFIAVVRNIDQDEEE